MKQRAQRMSVIVLRVMSLQLLKLLPQLHISINRVEVSDDLNYATLWVSSFTAQEDSQDLLTTIQAVQPRLQDSLAQNLKTKYTPKLRFKLDPAKAYADHIDNLLEDLR